MKYLTLLVFYLCTVVASSASFVFPLGSSSEWYMGLIHPWFSPPNWLFGPVWTILYILIAVSAWRLMYAFHSEWKPLAISLWSLQMGLNTIWTPVFSGSQNLEVAFYYIIALWVSIVGYIVVSWRVDRWASIMFMPYLGWVSFASLLNYNYWQLN